MFDTVRARFKARGTEHSHHHGHHHHAAPPALPGVEPWEPCTPGVDCEHCPNREVTGSTLPLCRLEPGDAACIVAVDEGRRFRKRLADLGLAVGMEVHVMRASRGRGPMILAICNDSRLALGWGIANKILVEKQAEGANA
jgi:ferrous iron transport protein A